MLILLEILENMAGVFANAASIITGSIIGLLFKKAINKDMSDLLMKGLGLCVLFIGIQGAMNGKNSLIMILSIVIGTVIGTLLRLDDRMNSLGIAIESKFKKKDEKTSIAEGFVTSSLVFCVGAMAIVGSLNSGLYGDHTMLYTKSLLDFVSACVFASTLGFGVMLSSVAIVLYQGLIVLLSAFVSPLFTDVLIAEVTCVGSILIMGIGVNFLGNLKIKVMNMLPAIFVPLVLCLFI